MDVPKDELEGGQCLLFLQRAEGCPANREISIRAWAVEDAFGHDSPLVGNVLQWMAKSGTETSRAWYSAQPLGVDLHVTLPLMKHLGLHVELIDRKRVIASTDVPFSELPMRETTTLSLALELVKSKTTKTNKTTDTFANSESRVVSKDVAETNRLQIMLT